MRNQLTSSDTAILLFSYSEKQKASLRKLAPRISSKKLDSLIAKLNLQAKQVSKKTQLPFFQFNANSENSFEKQLYSAYQELFDQGYSKVIGITNDCPGLNENDLEKALHSLQHNQLVLGPAKDGGLYLLGIQKGSFSKKEFLSLKWQSSELYTGIKELINDKSLASESLVTKSDMDTVAEFQIAFDSHFQFLINFKGELLSYCKRRFNLHQLIELKFSSLSPSLRAPPICS